MGGILSRMGFKKSSKVRNSSSSSVNSSSGSQVRSRPINQPVKNLRPKITGIITKTGRKSSFGFNNRNNFSPSPQAQSGPSPQAQAQLTKAQTGHTPHWQSLEAHPRSSRLPSQSCRWQNPIGQC